MNASSWNTFQNSPPIQGLSMRRVFLLGFEFFFGIRNLIGSIFCSSLFNASLIPVLRSLFLDSLFGVNFFLNVLELYSFFVYHFGHRSGPLGRLF
jgi:hypothetical protein